jgi:hypothetical protein
MRLGFPGGRRLRSAAALLLALGLTGCGSKYHPVRGTVTLDDGTPVTKGMVVFEGEIDGAPVSARGEIKPDGTYQLSTAKPGDGVPAGKYRVLINPLDLSEVPDEKKNIPFHFKYMKFESSELEFEIKPGPNDIPIKLERSNRRPR